MNRGRFAWCQSQGVQGPREGLTCNVFDAPTRELLRRVAGLLVLTAWHEAVPGSVQRGLAKVEATLLAAPEEEHAGHFLVPVELALRSAQSDGEAGESLARPPRHEGEDRAYLARTGRWAQSLIN